jgi:hypothetical protein
MVDEEIVLRFFALNALLNKYRTPLKRFLNEYMDSSKNLVPDSIAILKEKFEKTTSTVNRLIGPNAFRITDRKGKLVDRTVNRALFDAQMLA